MKRHILALWLSLLVMPMCLFAKGYLVSEPTKSAKIYAFKNPDTSSTLVSWHRGNGQGSMVVASRSPIALVGIDSIDFVANDTFGNGDTIKSDVFVVYKGLDSSFTLRGLNANTLYYYKIFDFNGGGDSVNYLIDSFVSPDHYTKPIAPSI